MFNDPAAQMRQVHIDSLKQRFEGCVSELQAGAVYSVRDAGTSGLPLPAMMLHVGLPSSFPKDAPRLTAGSTTREVIVEGSKAWSVNTMLAEYVEAGFESLRRLWGPVGPPTDSDIPDLSALPADVVADIHANPFCLESYAYQVPYVKRLREESTVIVSKVEAEAKKNLSHRPMVEQLKDDIEKLQDDIRTQAEGLGSLKDDAATITQYGSAEGLMKAYTAEAKAIKEQSDTILQAAQTAGAKEGGLDEFDVALEEYRRLRKQWHTRDIKRRAFPVSDPLAAVN